MESIKLSVQTDHKFLTRASIFCRCVTNVKTLIVHAPVLGNSRHRGVFHVLLHELQGSSLQQNNRSRGTRARRKPGSQMCRIDARVPSNKEICAGFEMFPQIVSPFQSKPGYPPRPVPDSNLGSDPRSIFGSVNGSAHLTGPWIGPSLDHPQDLLLRPQTQLTYLVNEAKK